MEEHRSGTVSDPMPDNRNGGVRETPDQLKFENSHPRTGDEASHNKLFVGGLAQETTPEQFTRHFGKYGEITDSNIMKNRKTGISRGFGFVTYADASVVNRVIEETHIINGKQVEIKRAIPRISRFKDFEPKKIFVGSIPTTISEDEFRDFFSKYGEVKGHQIVRDKFTGRSRGFGFVTFESDQCVDDLLKTGNMLYLGGSQVEIKRAEPMKPYLPAPPSTHQSNSIVAFGGGHQDTYVGYDGGFGSGNFGGSSYNRPSGVYGSRAGDYGGLVFRAYGGPEFHGYGGYAAPGYGVGDPVGYRNHLGGGLGRGGYDGAGYGGGDPVGYMNHLGSGLGRGYDVGNEHGRAAGYGAGGRYHPYGR